MTPNNVNYETLIAYAAGELPADRRAEIQQHLQSTPADAATVRLLERAIGTMRTDDTVAPPTDTLAKARAIFAPSRQTLASRWWQAVERVVAELTFDSKAEAALVGLRGTAETRQLAFTAEDVELDLQINPAAPERNDEARIVGQITMDVLPDEAEVVLLSGDDAIAQAEVDDDGMFALHAPSGEYQVAIRLGERKVIVSDVEVL